MAGLAVGDEEFRVLVALWVVAVFVGTLLMETIAQVWP
jgi:hypothetical protein